MVPCICLAFPFRFRVAFGHDRSRAGSPGTYARKQGISPVNLVLSLRGDGRLELRPSRVFRVLLGMIAAVLGTAIAFSAAAGENTALMPLLLMAASLLASLYEERWIFSADGGIESRHGLLFLKAVRIYPSEEVEKFTLSSFTKGKLRGTDPQAPSFLPSYLVLAVETRGDGDRTIEILRYAKKERLETRAAKIAGFCSKPLLNRIG